MRFVVLISVLLVGAAGAGGVAAQEGGDRITGAAFASRSPVVAKDGMAATSQPLATQIAVEILKKGGSAVDAAIAANAALGLMEPTGCGIGGDLFAIVWDPATKKLHGYNGSGRSPKGMTREALLEKLAGRTSIPAHGALPVSVPGAVDGWFALHAKFGKLPMKDVLAPAIRYAEEGFPLSQLVAYYWRLNAASFQRSADLEEKENFEKTFLVDGRAPREGELFANPDLAASYRLLAAKGRGAFYDGPIAKSVDALMRRVGGALRLEDFTAHRGEWVEPVSTSYRGYELWELPPNGQGLAALQMLNILEGFDIGALERNGAEHLHLMIEAKKLAFEDRAKFYADPAFGDLPIATLSSKEYGRRRAKLLDRRRAARSIPAGDPRLERGDTIYLTTADSSGMMVSWIQSNYFGMGSGLVADGTGFVLQDRGVLFHLDEGHANAYEPGKRPFHTIIPAFLTQGGQPRMSFGVMGGSMQPQGHVQIVSNIVDFGLNVQEAGDAARFNHGGSSQPTGEVMTDGGVVALESGIPLAVRRDLEARGHKLTIRGSFGGYQAIWRDPKTGVYFGASEMRKDGQAAGF